MTSQLAKCIAPGSFNKLRWLAPSLSNIRYSSSTTDTISGDPNEVLHHEKLATNWWDTNGPVKGLHSMNSIRVPFIRDGLISNSSINTDYLNTTKVLSGLSILEVGCGGGILTEQLARIHANIVGIDLGEDLINVAKKHLENESPEISKRVTYQVESIESHAKTNGEKYDAVVISEVLEHVPNKADFLSSCIETVKPGGLIFITTLNKTIPMWVTGVLLGEYVLNLVPKGTHHWDQLVPPNEVKKILHCLNCSTIMINGCIYEFLTNTWKWIPSTQFMYALQAVKNQTT